MSRRSATSANSVKATASHHHENNMIIAKAKRKENIAEYLLYMWQVEDIIRAYGLDIEKINANIVQRYDTDDKTRHEITEWYEGLIKMMELETKRQNGHLQININTLIMLTDLHQQLLKSTKYPAYGAEFYRTLPYIVELRAKTPQEEKAGEIETCFNALYGMLMLKLQGKEITKGTETAMKQISHFVAILAAYFKQDEEHPLFDDNND